MESVIIEDEMIAMLLDERRTRILDFIEQRGFVSLQQLLEELGVSESTVRRDLEYLDGIGQVRRTRGGAAYVGESISPFEDRTTRSLPQKKQVATRVAEMISDGETVLLDGGTTTLEVARQLGGKSLQVVTNSLPIAGVLVNQPNIELIFVGGYLYPKTGVALGPMTVEAIKNVHARRLIMSVGGITEAGLFNSNTLLVETEREMIEAADEVIVVADSGKLGHSALAHLCPLDAVDKLVVDAGISPDWKKTLEAAGIEVNVVEDSDA